MVEITPFASRAELAANRRLRAFIELGRNTPNPFGTGINFESDAWDVTDAVKGSGLGRTRITFTTLKSAKSKDPVLMRLDAREFAKSYLVRLQQINPTKGVQQRLAALRAIEAALQSHDLLIPQLRADIFDHAAKLVADHYNGVGAYRIGAQLALIAEFLAEERLVAAPFQWGNPLRRPRDQVRVGPEHEAKRAKRLPTGATVEAVTLAFRRASHPSDRLVAALAALLCCAPVRIGEVLRMRENCEVEDRTADGTPAYGLRWWTEKGSEPEVRWIPATMAQTARIAIGIVKEVTAQARRIATWYERNPASLYLPPQLEHLRSQRFIDLYDADHLLGADSQSWGVRKGVRIQRMAQSKVFDFKEFEAAVFGDLPDGFPIIEKATALRASEALFLVQFNEFRTDRGSSLCMIEPVVQRQVRDALGARVEHGVPSMFSRLELTNDDGSPISVKTHAFRHWLNTLAQRAGVDPLDIAKWSGRQSVSQNAAYDHVSAEELLEDLGEVTGTSTALPIQVHRPASRDDFAITRNGAAHVTEFGFCLHDFAMLPCQLHSDCLNCEEHVCVKGDLAKEKRLVAFLAEAKRLLHLAEEGSAEGYEGAHRWKDHQERTVLRAERIVALLTDPNVPASTIIGDRDVAAAVDSTTGTTSGPGAVTR